MMITREADYAIRVVLFLAQAEKDGRDSVTSAVLSEEMEIPYRFLRKIMSRMAAADLIRSRRGKGGGLALARHASEISLADVIKAMDLPGSCFNLCLEDPKCCNRVTFCPVHKALQQLQGLIDNQLGATTFDTLCE